MTILNIPQENQSLVDKDQIKNFMHERGILYEYWPNQMDLPLEASPEEILQAYDFFVTPFMAKFGYQSCDVITVHAQTANIEQVRAKFLKEHTHAEDEVRFFVEGQGLFWFHLDNGEVFSLLCTKGDLISVPTGFKHWFDLGPQPFVKVIRMFTDPAGWVAHYTESGIDRSYNNEK